MNRIQSSIRWLLITPVSLSKNKNNNKKLLRIYLLWKTRNKDYFCFISLRFDVIWFVKAAIRNFILPARSTKHTHSTQYGIYATTQNDVRKVVSHYLGKGRTIKVFPKMPKIFQFRKKKVISFKRFVWCCMNMNHSFFSVFKSRFELSAHFSASSLNG